MLQHQCVLRVLAQTACHCAMFAHNIHLSSDASGLMCSPPPSAHASPPLLPPLLPQVRATWDQFKEDSKAASSKAKHASHGMSDKELAEIQKQMFAQARQRCVRAGSRVQGWCSSWHSSRRQCVVGWWLAAAGMAYMCCAVALRLCAQVPGGAAAARPGCRSVPVVGCWPLC
jgi:hypothetical protein